MAVEGDLSKKIFCQFSELSSGGWNHYYIPLDQNTDDLHELNSDISKNGSPYKLNYNQWIHEYEVDVLSKYDDSKRRHVKLQGRFDYKNKIDKQIYSQAESEV